MTDDEMTLPEIDTLDSLVRDAAKRELVPGFGDMDYEYKADGSVVTAADAAMQDSLIGILQQHWPQYQVLGEEMTAEEQQEILSAEGGYWCIDPLDGTNNYATGMPFFATSIALIIDGVVEMGYIHDPMRDETFSAIRGQGARLNGAPLKPPVIPTPDNKLLAEIDLKRLPRELAFRLITEPPFGSQRNIGSSALDWTWLAAGRYNVYLHGGQHLWDYSAGQLIVAESGGISCALDGEPVFRNRLEKRSALATLDHGLFERWKEWIGIPVE